MAERPGDEGVTRVVVVEDGLAFAKTMLHAVNRLREDERQACVTDIVDQDEALRRSQWDDVDVVLVDAYASDRQRRRPDASLFAGLEVAQHLAEHAPATTRVVAYSAVATLPEVNIPLSELANVVARYEPGPLLTHLSSAVWDPFPTGRLTPPGPADYAALGVGPRASVTAALERMRSRADAWALLTGAGSPTTPEPRTRDFVNVHVRPLLDIEQPRYRLAVQVLQRVTHLPV